MKTIAIWVLMGIFGFIAPLDAKAQTINTLGENTLNGALTGTLLGGASMALTNETDFYPLQVGLGLGTLYGLGMGAYDLFGFGLFDTFVLADRSTSLSFAQPAFYEIPTLSSNGWTSRPHVGIDFVRLELSF